MNTYSFSFCNKLMKKNHWLVLAFGLFMSTPIMAQRTVSEAHGNYQSTVCNADGTVTFNYRNDRAKDVQVDVQFAGRKPMTRDAQTGLWSVTLGPAAPDMYPYCFVVDGVSIMDPQCDQFFPNEGFKNSLLEIPAREGSLAHDIKDVPHGTIVYIHYYSKSLGATNNAIVYLPPSYMWNPDKRYPVFYLISGTTDTEEVYYKVGRMNYILDNLLAEGKAQEMIIVLPYGNPYKLLPSIPDMAGVPQTRFGGDVFSKDLNDDLMPYIDDNFRTLADRDHRAIGGFSRGGNQALFNGLSHLDKFSYLCSYSSFTSTDIPDVYDNAADTNVKIHLFWLGVGTDDFLFGNARDYMEHLDKKGIRSVKEFTHDKFGHTWMNARYFLDKTLRLLFNPEASEAAMRQGQPAPAATGKEPQFTAGVMARMFPRPIISPDYRTDAITFRFKAPDAQQVMLQYELEEQPIAMQKDSDGVWTAEVSNPTAQVADWPVFTYYFIVDGMAVADPNNMYLAPQHGFKPSIARHPQSRYSFASMGDIPHARVTYQPSNDLFFYTTPAQYYNSTRQADSLKPITVTLIPGENDTPESWFKIGGANAIADALLASNQIPPVSIFSVKDLEKVSNALVLRASDFKTWSERSKALEQLLLNHK